MVPASVPPAPSLPGVGQVFAAATAVAVVAELFPGAGSATAFVTVAVLLIAVATAVPGLTRTRRIKTELWPAASDASVHEMPPVPPTAGVEQDQACALPIERNVVLAGTVSASVTPIAVAGPAFETVIVYAMSRPAATGSGRSLLVTPTLALAAGDTTVVVIASVLSAGTLSTLLLWIVGVVESTVPFGVVDGTFTTIVKLESVPSWSAAEQRTVSLVPTGGVTQVHVLEPPVTAAETNVVPAGRTCVSTGFVAVPDAVSTRYVYVRFPPAVSGSGASVTPPPPGARTRMSTAVAALTDSSQIGPSVSVRGKAFDDEAGVYCAQSVVLGGGLPAAGAPVRSWSPVAGGW